MKNYYDNRNDLFNLLIDIRKNHSYPILFEMPMQRMIMPKYKFSKEDGFIPIKPSELEIWMVNSKKHDEYFELLKKWKIKQDKDSRIVSIAIDDNIFKFNLDEIELICEMI